MSISITNDSPGLDHYLVYNIKPIPKKKSVLLQDQFDKARKTWTKHELQGITYFANPASKNDEKPSNEMLHYTWWNIDGKISETVHIHHQLIHKGKEHEWKIERLAYLVMPAWKNQKKKKESPNANYYKAYEVEGPAFWAKVSIKDQWNDEGKYRKLPFVPRFLLTPTIKKVEGEKPKKIVDKDAHLACYQIPRILQGIGSVLEDQFVRSFFFASNFADYLCIPCSKRLKQKSVRVARI